ncbi:hypothetical protein EPO15_02460 [bacterium]|nr:MAG: hypothetical protein EPO15_02460 [bacterium]
MAPEPQSRGPALVVVAVLGLSTVMALAVLLKGGPQVPTGKGGGPNSAMAKASRVWPEEAAPPVQDPEMLRPDANRSGLDMVGRPDDAASPQMPGASGSPAASEGRPAATQSPDGGPAPGASAVELTAAEKAALSEAAGRDMTDPKKAAEVGGHDGPWSALVGAVARSSRLMKFLLNNEAVVNAFMSRPTSKKFCGSASAYKNYLTNTAAPGGVTHAMNVFEKALHANPENPTVMFSSKLGEAITECPSVKSIVKDRSAIQEIATSNPRALSLMLDPALMKGLSANPAAMGAFGGIQASLTAGKQ